MLEVEYTEKKFMEVIISQVPVLHLRLGFQVGGPVTGNTDGREMRHARGEQAHANHHGRQLRLNPTSQGLRRPAWSSQASPQPAPAAQTRGRPTGAGT